MARMLQLSCCVVFGAFVTMTMQAVAQVDPYPDNVDNVWECRIDGLGGTVEFHTTVDGIDNNVRLGFATVSSDEIFEEFEVTLGETSVLMTNWDDDHIYAEITYNSGAVVFRPDPNSNAEMHGQCEKTF